MCSFSLIFFLLGDWLVGFFSEVENAREVAKQAMYIMATGFIFYGVGMVMINAFNGSGDTWSPTKVNFFGFWLFQIPVAYLLARYFEMGVTGVFIAIPVAEGAITVVSFILFKRGKWKLKKV